ncbi:competence protein ComA [Rodentibacter trehalosifermentans]|uniref:Competence protein ComA n=1 Tax=Rodentibacter trehalosifermentans TaxID=1908263 RepID=A0A1V3IQ26_9PAST|nr:pilus assembly protein PilM [Rodentibacter trehalosifermentans]OOF44293.1 competence protein ComA [Rodentibacter trehalosifermentans]OOF47402.1 competence protein ComA [Rodentibacter trehalosifermentans]
MPIPYKKRQIIQIGVHQQRNQFQFVWFDKQSQIQSFSISDNERDIETHLMNRLIQDFSQVRLKLRLVGCISPHLIWSKSLILPQSLNAQECEQQCRFVLQKELPIPFEELWFDYISTPLKQGFRLEIYAVRRMVAQEAQKAYGALSLDVLDVAYYAILRSFRLFLGEDQDNSLYLYQDESHCFAMMNTHQGLQLLQTQENLTALYTQFCQRFETESARIYVYQTDDVQRTDLPESWQRVETELPFIALGNSLWQKDFVQNNGDSSTALLNGCLNEGH